MAKEMMNYTKYNLLAQVAQFMIAQTSQQAKNVLFLLTQSLEQAKWSASSELQKTRTTLARVFFQALNES